MARQARTDFTANDKTKGAFRSLTNNMGALKPAMVAGMTAIGTATAMVTQKVLQMPGKMREAFQQTAQEMDDLAKTAKRLDVPVATLDAMTHAAELSGAGARDLQVAFRTAAKQISDASRGIGESKVYLDRMGISVRDTNGALKSTDQIILEFADKQSLLSGSTERTAAAMTLFGRSGMQLMPMLNAGSAGIRDMMSEAAGLGLRTQEMTAAAEETIDAQLRWNKSMRAFKDMAMVSVMPIITDMANWLSTHLANALSDVNKEFREWTQQQKLADGTQGYQALIEKGTELSQQMTALRAKSEELGEELEYILKTPGARGSSSTIAKINETNDQLKELEAQYNHVRDAIRQLVEEDDKRAKSAKEQSANEAERQRQEYQRLIEEESQKLGTLEDERSNPLRAINIEAEEIASRSMPMVVAQVNEMQASFIEAADGFSLRMGNAFASVITGSQTASQAMKSVFMGAIADIASEMTRRLVLQGLVNLIPGGGALGAALGIGRVGGGSGLPSLAPAASGSAPGGVTVNLNSFAPITTADQIAAASNLADASVVQDLFQVEG